MPSLLTVALVHYDAADWVRSAASTIARSDPPVELVVVSNSGPVDVPAAEVIVNPANLGFSGAANVALRRWLAAPAPAPYSVVGSHDLHVAPDTFRRLVEFMNRSNDVGICAPAMADAARGPSRGAGDHDWLSGQCLLFRRECAQALGGFDERFGSYVEDVDIGLRAWDAGWRVTVVDGAPAHGLGSRVGSGRARRLRWANQVGLARKRGGAGAGVRLLLAQPALGARSLGLAATHPGRAGHHLGEARDRLLAVPAAARQLRRFRGPEPPSPS